MKHAGEDVSYLEAVESAGFWDLNFRHKSIHEILVDDPVTGGKEGQHVLDEVLLFLLELLPVVHVAAEVDLLCRPEGGHCFFVHSPDIYQYRLEANGQRYLKIKKQTLTMVLDREDDESLVVLLEKRFFLRVEGR